MKGDHLIVLSIPGLRPEDVRADATPTLHDWASRGAIAELVPSFPCVTSPVQASMLTGTPPARHGVVANGFYDRAGHDVAFWVGHHDVVAGEPVWDAIRRSRPEFTSAVWHAQNIKGASADLVVTPAPIHKPDGGMQLWCYSKPSDLYQRLLDDLGHFPLQHYWGPLANIESTRWILRAAVWLIRREAPNFHWIYVPHLDYAAQKFGPNSPEAGAALVELDRELAWFAAQIAETPIGDQVIWLVAGEYAMTDVNAVVFPNRLLRDAGLLSVRDEASGEMIELAGSAAFAMVDHQFAHVYCSEPRSTAGVVELFHGRPGVAVVLAGSDREKLGIDHPRSGDVVLVAEDTSWFAYYWWLDDRNAPGFARTVDIHRKPGYDPVELYFDPATKGIPLNAALVKGSHGVPATAARHRAAIIVSPASNAVQTGGRYRDTDVRQICLSAMGLSAGSM